MAEIDRSDARSVSERRGSDRKKLIIDVRFEGGDSTGIAGIRFKDLSKTDEEFLNGEMET